MVVSVAKKIAQLLKANPEKQKKFLDFIETGKYKDKDTGKIINVDKEAAKVEPKDLDLETMDSLTRSKMKKGGLVRGVKIAKKGFRKAKIY